MNSEFIRQVNQIVQPCLAASWSHMALLDQCWARWEVFCNREGAQRCQLVTGQEALAEPRGLRNASSHAGQGSSSQNLPPTPILLSS